MLHGENGDNAWAHIQLWDATNSAKLYSGTVVWEGHYDHTNTTTIIEEVTLTDQTDVQLRLQAGTSITASNYNKVLMIALRVAPAE